jgi:hypothetical protein
MQGTKWIHAEADAVSIPRLALANEAWLWRAMTDYMQAN